MWITMYHSGIGCYILLCKWEKVESEHHYVFSDKYPRCMRIVETIYTAEGLFGSYEIKIFKTVGLRLSELVRASKNQ